MRTRIKICCIASLEEARLAIRYGADAIGIVAADGPRMLEDRTIAAITAAVPPPIATFVLISDLTADRIAEHVRATGPTAVQIVSHISPAESHKLIGLLPTTRRVQVIHVEDGHALDLIPSYAPNAHAFLLDSGRPSLETPQYGGTGRTHDWEMSAEFVRRSPLPVFLAGGLSPNNVDEAIRKVRPFAVDLCSGVRTDGRLDKEKLAGFIDAVRQADAGDAQG